MSKYFSMRRRRCASHFLRSLRQLFGCGAIAVLSACGGSVELTPADLLNRASDLSARGEFPRAVVDLKLALQRDPSLHEARWLLGKAYLGLHDGVTAEAHFDKLRAVPFAHDGFDAAYFRALLMQQRYDDVLRMALNNPEPDVLTVLGEANLAVSELQTGVNAQRLGDAHIAMAKSLFDKALERDQTNYRARLGLARVELLAGNFDAAAALLAAIEMDEPVRPQAAILLGVIGQLRADLDAAEAAYRRALAIAPYDLSARVGLARVLIGRKKRTEAVAFVRALKRDHPKRLIANTLLAHALLLNRQAGDAVSVLQKVRDDYPDDDESSRLLIRAWIELDSYEQAANAAHDRLGRNPEDRFARRVLAEIELKRGNSEVALTELRRLSAGDFRALALLGKAQISLGNVERGEWYLERARKAASAAASQPAAVPVSLWANFIPGGISGADVETAQSMAESRLAENPDDPAAHYELGQVNLANGDEPAARKAFHAALQRDDSHVPSLLALAVLDAAANKPEVARLMYQRVLAADRSNVAALVGLSRLEATEQPD